MGGRGRKALRVVSGMLIMAAFVVILFGILSRYAGGWGVPLFSFRTQNGSPCRNGWVGYTCTNLTLADLEFLGQVQLPPTTRIVSSRYHATSEYQLDATVVAPKANQAALYHDLVASFGHCQPGHPTALDVRGLTQVCVLANDNNVTTGGRTAARIYVVGTGVRRDGARIAVLQIRSA